MNYKLLAFDIDGTIREPGFEISNQLKETLKLLKNKRDTLPPKKHGNIPL